MNNVFFGCFESKQDMIQEFAGTAYSDEKTPESVILHDLDGAEILFAGYGCPSYEGYAIVIFRKGDEFFEVYGSHCSCMGLEGQWGPELVDVKHLKDMDVPGYYEFEADAIAAFAQMQRNL